ncbi:MAG: RDD family protein [Butyricicoccus sp.]|nr:RDD family protein [Butyricicoccus sp.]
MKTTPVPLIRRLAAYIVDWYLAAVLCGAPLLLVNSMRTGSTAADTSIPSGASGWLWGIVAILIGTAYYWLLPLVWHGQTPGKRLMHLRIIGADGEQPAAGALFLRQAIGILLIEGAVAFPSQLLRELLARAAGDSAANIVRIAMVAATLVSIGLGMYTPDRRMLHDRISGTREVLERKD